MKIQNRKAFAVIAGIGIIGCLANAAPVNVQNYSFEIPDIQGQGPYYAVPGWQNFGSGYQQIVAPQPSDNQYNLNADGSLPTPGDGYQYFSVNGAAAGGPGGIFQDVSGLLPNTTYTLTVAVGWRGGIGNGVSSIELVNGTDNGGKVLASTNVDITTLTQENFSDCTIVYTTGPIVSGDLTIVLQSTSGVQANFDNVRLDAALPTFGTPVTLANSSFETPALGSGNVTYSIPGWTSLNAGAGVAEADWSADFNFGAGDVTNLPAPADGYQFAFINGGGAIYQDAGALQPLTQYNLLVAVGADYNTSWGEGWGQIVLVNGTDNTGKVLAATVINNVNATTQLGSGQGVDGYFRNYYVTFTTPASVSGDLTVLLETTNGVQICYDDVRLYTAVPYLPPVVAQFGLSSAVAYPGQPVTISASASGFGTLNYGFEYDNGSGGATWSWIEGSSTNSSYVETAPVPPGTYQFRVVVTNTYGAVTSSPAILNVAHVGPTLVQTPIPVNENLAVGQTGQMSAVFNSVYPITYQWQIDRGDGNGPVNVTNGTYNSPTLVINNLQASDAGSYTVVATHAYGATTNATAVTLAVAPAPNPDAFGNLVYIDNENNSGAFTPTYTLPSGSLIAGQLPSSEQGPYSVGYDPVGGDITNVTSGGPIVGGDKSLMIEVGNNGNACQSITYQLNTIASPQGYNLTSLVAIGGWADYGRDEVAADVLYSTVSDPGNFVQCAFYDNTGPNPAQNSPPVNWVVVTPSNDYLATNVAAVQFNFVPGETGGVENGYVGLFQLGVYGTPVQPPGITIARSGANIVLTWPSGTLYSASNLTGPWTIVTGATSPWTVLPGAPRQFYQLR